MNQCNFDNEYLGMKNTVCCLQVVNDTAERSIKDIQEYANAARDGGMGEKKIIQVSHSYSEISIFPEKQDRGTFLEIISIT